MNDLILDFNNKELLFDKNDILKYNILTIENNVKKFKEFMYELSLNKDFDTIYETAVFQVTFLDDTSNYLENLVVVYNAIATNKLINDKQYPTIDENSFIAQMDLRGWECYRTRLTVSRNNYRYVRKFRKKNTFVWN